MSSTNIVPTTQSIPISVGNLTDARIEKRFAATEAQLEVWLSCQQCVEANCAYNEISSLVIEGELDQDRLTSAITKVVERNEALRSTFSADGQEMIVRKDPNYEYESHDFSGQSKEAVEANQNAILSSQAIKQFDLTNGPLLRAVLQKLGPSSFKLTFVAHHVVLDGWSLAVFCRDLGHIYDSLGGHSSEDLPTAHQYSEYSQLIGEYMESEAGNADESFWINQFSDSIPVLDLPIVNGRPPLRTYEGQRYDHVFDANLVERIRKVGAKSGCSLFNAMLAAFNAYVARISGANDFCVGIPTAGQAAMDRPELIGHCVNTMPLRTQVDVSSSFVDYMKSVRSNLLDAFEHQRYSYGSLLRKLAPPRDPSRPPMLNVSFNIDPEIDLVTIGFQGLDVSLKIEPRSYENFEWFVNGVIQNDKSIELQVQFNSDLHTQESMAFYMEGFQAFLESLVDDPNLPFENHHLMSIPQRQQVIVDWNDTVLEYPADATLHSEFSRQASKTPDKVAIRFEQTELTYGEVDSRSNQIARYLQNQGVQIGDLIGICVERNEHMLVYLMAILKAGAGYVPLDPTYPSDRLSYMCDHSGLKLIVTQNDLEKRIAEFKKPVLAIDSVESDFERLDMGPLQESSQPSDICYVIYTSGSTGKPKGVQVPHGSVVNFLCSMKHSPGFSADDSVLAVTTLSFDIAVLELYLPTLFGGTVVLLDSLSAADGSKIVEQIERHNISVMQATPATWRLMIQSGWAGKSDLKVLCGGEPMPNDLVGPLLERCSELWNMYGPTETTVWSAVYQVNSADDPILIGKPIGNTQIYILDGNGNEVPAGCEGEVYIGGAGVTLGYRSQPEMTNERFVENRYRNPFTNYVSEKLYRTGDLARYRTDGNIQFLRRTDKQVKVRGYRIELGEIESSLDQMADVRQCVVIVREDIIGDARLVAYVVTDSSQSIDADELRNHVRASLPFYMVPQHFVQLESIPQTNNGKIDYKELPAPGLENPGESGDAVPQTEAEKYLASVWMDVLETDDVDLNDMFFDIGGHSLLVMKVITSVLDTTGVKLSPQDFLIGTLEQLADKLPQSVNSGQQRNTADHTVETRPFDAVATEVSAENDKEDPETDELAEKNQGIIKKLTGFWN